MSIKSIRLLFVSYLIFISVSNLIITKQSFADSNFSVNGTITPTASNFPISITASPVQSVFNQNSVITFTITYGATMGGSIQNMTIEADWSKDTPNQSSVDIFDYVPSSASNAYNNTAPVIDTVDRKIDWTISSFPGPKTNQTVTFKLKTNGNYTGQDAVTLLVAARTITSYLTTSDSTTLQTYQYMNQSSSPTPTPTPNTTSVTPTTIPTSTPTPTPSQATFVFTAINLVAKNQNGAQIKIDSSTPFNGAVYYGTNSFNLINKITLNAHSNSQIVNIKNLDPNTTYYFQVEALNVNTSPIYSNIYTFTTAKNSQPPQLELNSLIVTNNNTAIYSSHQQSLIENKTISNPIINLPTSTDYEISIVILHKLPLKYVKLIVQNKNILGSNTFASSSDIISEIPLIEKQPGIFVGSLVSPPTTGTYELYVQIADSLGNITESKIGEINNKNPFTVVDYRTNAPLEGVRIIIYKFDPLKKGYVILQNDGSIINSIPYYTDIYGVARFVLSPGKYRANLSLLAYSSQQVYFSIGNSSSDGFPFVKMQSQPFNVGTYITFIENTLLDAYGQTMLYIQNLSDSNRFFNLVSTFTIALLVLTTFLLFLFRIHISINHFPRYIAFYIRKLFGKKHDANTLSGIITDQDKKPLSRVEINVIMHASYIVYAEGISDKKGRFFIKIPGSKYDLLAIKEGHEVQKLTFNNDTPYEKKIEVVLTNIKKSQHHIKTLLSGGQHLLGFLFETALLLSFIYEFFFINFFGLAMTAPYLVLSIFNLLIWILFLKQE